MVSGVLYAVQGLTVWLSEPPFFLSIPYLDSASDLTWQTLVNVTDVVLLVGALAAVATLPTLHREFYGMTVTLVSLVTIIGLALLLVVGVTDVFQWFRSWSSAPLIWGLMLVALGGMGLGAVTIAAGVLPWWCGVALIVGGPSIVSAGLLGELSAVIAGVAWTTVGYAIFRTARRRTERPPRVR